MLTTMVRMKLKQRKFVWILWENEQFNMHHINLTRNEERWIRKYCQSESRMNRRFLRYCHFFRYYDFRFMLFLFAIRMYSSFSFLFQTNDTAVPVKVDKQTIADLIVPLQPQTHDKLTFGIDKTSSDSNSEYHNREQTEPIRSSLQKVFIKTQIFSKEVRFL